MRRTPSTLRGDIFGGITAGIVALPLALAFGVVSGMGAAAGLYGAIALGFFAALFGGTPTQVSGPTGPMTVISAVVIAKAIQSFGSLDAAMPLILVTFLLTGGFQILLGLCRIGQYVRYIPHSVISGFMTGIGVIIILLQVYPLLGARPPSSAITVITQLHTVGPHINPYAIALALGTIAIIYLAPRVTKLIPSQLIALIVMSAIAMIWKMPIHTIGTIPAGLPPLQLGTLMGFDLLNNLHLVVVPAVTLAALGVIDSLLTSIVADNLTKSKHHSNKELIGQGIGNAAAALIGGIPGAGATMRTVVNINSGGRTRLSGIVHALVLLAIVLGAHNLAADIPMPVLAGILITVGIGIIDYKGIKHLPNIPATDGAVMIIVFAMTVFVDLLQAVLTGLVLSSVLFMKKMGELNEEKTRGLTLKNLLEESPLPDERDIAQELGNQVYIKHLYGPLFFGFTSEFTDHIQNLPQVKIIILRLCDVPYIDQSGLYALEEAVRDLQQRGIQVYLTGIQAQPMDRLKRLNIIPGLIGPDRVFEQFDACVKSLLVHSS